jgi:hypothetical protein
MNRAELLNRLREAPLVELIEDATLLKEYCKQFENIPYDRKKELFKPDVLAKIGEAMTKVYNDAITQY